MGRPAAAPPNSPASVQTTRLQSKASGPSDSECQNLLGFFFSLKSVTEVFCVPSSPRPKLGPDQSQPSLGSPEVPTPPRTA